MSEETTVLGQSIYDKCNEIYGNLDLIIKLCNDNGIKNFNEISNTPNFNQLLKGVNTNFIGFKYATNAINNSFDDGAYADYGGGWN